MYSVYHPDEIKLLGFSIVEYPPDRNSFISEEARINCIRKLEDKITNLKKEIKRINDLKSYYEGE